MELKDDISGHQSPQSIAVVGGGVAGIVAAYLLQRRHRVTLIEAAPRLGGHTHTVTIPQGPDAGTPVDTGFIVHNDRTYPLFREFIRQLEVAAAPTDMSFGYWDGAGHYWAGTDLRGLFARPGSWVSPTHWRFLWGINAFGRITRERLRAGRLLGLTLADHLDRERFHEAVIEGYVLPMGAAIWSAASAEMLDFPAESFARFYDNHGLLDLRERPTWHYIPGGSHSYVQAFMKTFGGKILTGHPIAGIRREPGQVVLRWADGREDSAFDAVVIATHADQACRLIEDPSAQETRLLSPWRYSRNETVLHTDSSWLPPRRSAWACWNYLHRVGQKEDSHPCVSYYMNRLQQLRTRNDYFVTLNPRRDISAGHRIAEMNYEHPIYDFASLNTQRELPELNGVNRTWFCGSYFAHGFHEDAVRSAVEVAEHFAIAL